MNTLLAMFLSFGLYVSACAQCQANFTYSTSNGTVNFTNTSIDSGLFTHWSFGDGSTSYDYNPTHTYSSTGNDAVYLPIFDRLTQCTECESVFYNVVNDSRTGFSFEEELVFHVYPNPTRGVVCLDISNDQVSEIVRKDIIGFVVPQKSIHTSTLEIDLSLYPKGLYFIHALGRKGQRLSTSKVLRQ